MPLRMRAGYALLIFAAVIIAQPAFAACKFKIGDVVALQEGSGDWRKSRVMGLAPASCTYKTTGPGGEFDYGNPESNVSESRLMNLAEAQKQGLIPQPKPSPQSVTVDPSGIDVRQLEQAILQATNKARTQPSSFASEINTKIIGTYQTKTFSDKSQQLWVTPPGESTSGYNVPTEADAYKSDVNSAVKFLRSQVAPTALKWSNGLARAARDHAEDPKINGHTGGDGSTASERMNRYGTGGRAENLGANHTTAFGYLASFIIDFRVPSRGHRKNIFNAAYTDLGVGCHYFAPADPQYYGFIRCVMNFGQSYQDKSGVVPSEGIVYVANIGDDTVTMIDAAREKKLKTVTGVGVDPAWVAVGPYGSRAYVTSKGKKLSVIDAKKQQVVDSWTLPHEPHGVAVSPDGNRVYVGTYELGAGQSITGYILQYKATDGTLEKTVQSGHNPGALSVSRNGERVYVSDGNGPGFYLDVAHGYSRHELSINGPMIENQDGSRLFAAGLLQVWGVETGTWKATVLDRLTIGQNQQFVDVVLSPGGSLLYATEIDMINVGGWLVHIDTKSNRVTKRLPLPKSGWNAACTLDGKKVFVTQATGDQVYVVDTATDTIRKLGFGKKPMGIAVGPAPIP